MRFRQANQWHPKLEQGERWPRNAGQTTVTCCGGLGMIALQMEQIDPAPSGTNKRRG